MKSHRAKDFGLFIIHVGLGLIFMVHGYPKLIGGIEMWQSLGSNMSLVKIYFLPTVWGFIAMLVEFFGGALLALGFGTRFISFLLAFQMTIATLYHINKSDSFTIYSHPLSLFIVAIGLMFTGSGRYSLDYYLKKETSC